MGVTISDNNRIGDVLRSIKKLKNKKINVGVFGNSGEDIVTIARVHEYGCEIPVTPKMRAWFAYQGFPLKQSTRVIKIPERSFIRTGFDENIDNIVRKVEKLLPQLLESHVNQHIFMDMVGLEFARMIQKKLKKLKEPADSSMTVQRKGSSNPLLDSGRLVGSIRHKVE